MIGLQPCGSYRKLLPVDQSTRGPGRRFANPTSSLDRKNALRLLGPSYYLLGIRKRTHNHGFRVTSTRSTIRFEANDLDVAELNDFDKSFISSTFIQCFHTAQKDVLVVALLIAVHSPASASSHWDRIHSLRSVATLLVLHRPGYLVRRIPD